MPPEELRHGGLVRLSLGDGQDDIHQGIFIHIQIHAVEL